MGGTATKEKETRKSPNKNYVTEAVVAGVKINDIFNKGNTNINEFFVEGEEDVVSYREGKVD